jgi:hypothetical protein
MKPWQALLHKAPNKGRNEEQTEMTQVPTKSPKWVTKGEGNKFRSKTPISCEKHICWGGNETWKNSKPRRIFIYNDGASLNKSGLHLFCKTINILCL